MGTFHSTKNPESGKKWNQNLKPSFQRIQMLNCFQKKQAIKPKFWTLDINHPRKFLKINTRNFHQREVSTVSSQCWAHTAWFEVNTQPWGYHEATAPPKHYFTGVIQITALGKKFKCRIHINNVGVLAKCLSAMAECAWWALDLTSEPTQSWYNSPIK